MVYEPLHHKYRPQTFAELVGQEAIAATLTNALRSARIAPAYLFTGARGTGKTSSARILAKSLNCQNSPAPTEQPCGICEVCQAIARGSALDVIEIDAASNTGVDNIRELIERSQFAPVQCRYKVYVVDECHMLSTAAFNALLKTLEEPPDRVVFVLATTDPQRVLPTIISRCQRFDFRRIPLEAMVQHLQQIAAKEAIEITPDALLLVAQISQGGLRDAESLLDQLSLLDGRVTVERVWDLVGAVPERDLLALVQAIAENDVTTVLEQARRLMDRGREPLIVLQNLASFYRDLLIAKTSPDRQDLVAITPPTWAELCEFVQSIDLRTLLWGQQQLRSSEGQVRNTTQPRLWLEVTLMSLLPATIALRDEGSKPGQTITPLPKPIAPRRTPAPLDVVPPLSPDKVLPETAPVVEPDAAPAAPEPPAPKPAAPEPATPEPVTSEPIAPEPVAPELIPAASAQSSEPAPSFDRMWQDILLLVQPISTQIMLRQQCLLLGFDGQVARVGARSEKLFRMAKERLPNIEAAFEKLVQHPVRVSLEVAASAPPAPAAPVSPTPPIAKEPAPTSRTPAQPDRSPAPPAPPSASPPVITSNPIEEPGQPTWQAEDEVSRASKSLAQMFNGQIVVDDASIEDAPIDLPSSEIAPPESIALIGDATPEDENEEDEDDVPF